MAFAAKLTVIENGSNSTCSRRNRPTCLDMRGLFFTFSGRIEGGDLEGAMNRYFDFVEEGWAVAARALIRGGDWSAAMEGSCGLMAYITKEKMVLGNLGDCRAVVVKRGQDGVMQTEQRQFILCCWMPFCVLFAASHTLDSGISILAI